MPGVCGTKQDDLAVAPQVSDSRGEVLGRCEVVEELIDRVSGEMSRRRRALASGKLKVETVDEGLMSLSARPEPHVLIRAPSPHRSGRVGCPEGRY